MYVCMSLWCLVFHHLLKGFEAALELLAEAASLNLADGFTRALCRPTRLA